MRWMCWLVVLVVVSPAFAQMPVEYHISFENAAHHEAEVTVTFSDLPSGTLEVRMSRTSPGRYALHEFAKNVYNVRATDSQGKPLTVIRANPHQWNIPAHDGTVHIMYTVFGDRSDGTYLGIDRTHAHMNIPATFMWARGLEDRPIVAHFEKPDPTWKIATQLAPTDRPDTFTAPNLAYFIDSPTEISDFDLREWTVSSNGNTCTIRLALHHEGTEQETDAYMRMARAVVLEQQAIFGTLPAYDYSTYTFIADYLPHVNGDGMEHRNSTILSSTGSLRKNPIGLLGTLSHEFFHCWNVERIRPRSLEPFDLEADNMSSELWFAEGFTSYYDDLTMKRAGLISLDRYTSGLSGTLNFVLNAPGRQFSGPAGMSRLATFVDRAAAGDRRNFSNTFVSYYSYGTVIALGLDLTIRQRFPERTLDDVIREVWKRHDKTENPYTNDDLQRILGDVTGDSTFAHMFFDRYILNHEMPDFAALLAQAGLLFRRTHPDSAWIGQVSFSYTGGRAILGAETRIGSPLYLAGLDRGDEIKTIAGRMLRGNGDLKDLLGDHNPGDTVEVEYISRGVEKIETLVFQANPQIEVTPYEHNNRIITPAMQAFRDAWLSSRVMGEKEALQRYCPSCRRTFPFAFDYCRYDGAELRITPKGEEMGK